MPVLAHDVLAQQLIAPGLTQRDAIELAPDVAIVLEATDAGDEVGDREALAMAALLGRRLAALGIAAVVVDRIVDWLLSEVSKTRPSPAGLRGMVFDGFGRGLVEREHERLIEGRVRTTRPFIVEPRLMMLCLDGPPSPEWLTASVATCGGPLLRCDAAVLLVRARFSEVPSRGALGELCAIVDAAGVVGARVVYDVDAEWAESLREAIQSRADIIVGEGALPRARQILRDTSSWTSLLRTWAIRRG